MRHVQVVVPEEKFCIRWEIETIKDALGGARRRNIRDDHLNNQLWVDGVAHFAHAFEVREQARVLRREPSRVYEQHYPENATLLVRKLDECHVEELVLVQRNDVETLVAMAPQLQYTLPASDATQKSETDLSSET